MATSEEDDLFDLPFWGDELQNFQEIHERILESFKCPVCYKYAHPPIPQCRSGHIVCETCDVKLVICPICNDYKSYWPSIFLDRFFGFITFPCNFTNEGCTFKGIGKAITEHELDCEFAYYECIWHDCSWEDSPRKLLDHLKSDHGFQHIPLPSGVMIVSTENFIDYQQYRTFTVTSIEAYGVHFLMVVRKIADNLSWSFFSIDRRLVDFYRVMLKIGRVTDEYQLRQVPKKFNPDKFRTGFINERKLNDWCEGNFKTFTVEFLKR